MPHTLRKSEDCYVDELFEPVVGLGAPLIAARFPRAYLDVNREPYELDPELFTGRVPEFANTQSARVVGGLGTIARIVADTEEIYRERLPIGAAFERIERLYRPFHAALADLLEATRKRFGIAILIDCHSMPSASMGQVPGGRPHFVLGDRFGASCDAKLTRFMRDILQGAGYEVQLNRPYAGGFITEYYGNPGARRSVSAARDQPRALSRRGDALQEQGFREVDARAQGHGDEGVCGAAAAARTAGGGRVEVPSALASGRSILHRNTTAVALGACRSSHASGSTIRLALSELCGAANSAAKLQCRPRKIKGAARRSVRPKSREETPKEGNETSELVVSLASPM